MLLSDERSRKFGNGLGITIVDCAERELLIKWLAHSGKPVLVEVYRTEADPGRHKETAHHAKWRDIVAEMMAEPRSSVKYDNVFPSDEGWG